MTDPLSISAGIAGLITLADSIFRRTFNYIKSVKEAPKEIAALSSEIGALYGILNHVSLIACQLERGTFDSAIQIHYIRSCYQTFEKVKTMLDKYDTLNSDRRSVDAMKRRLTWPFTITEAKSLIAEVERHKAALGLALTADGMTGLLTALSRQHELKNGVHEIKQQLRQRQEADTRIAIDRHRQKVLDSFGPCDPYKNHRMSLKLQYPGTGIWLTEDEDFKRWLHTPHSKLWLPGIPGAGKTILASSVIQEALVASSPNVAVAFFYCDYKDETTQDPLNILGSLARQLARQNEEAFELLQGLYEKHFLDNRMTSEYEPEELRDLVLDMASTFDSTLLLVDALDECGDNTSSVLELLASLNTIGNMCNVKRLFLSRAEQSIRDWLGSYPQIQIEARSGDLKLYVGAEIENRTRRNLLRLKDPSLKEHIMERLVSGAKGMFRWVTCQMDYLCELPTDSARKKALDLLPPTLDATYARILRRVNDSNHDVQVLVQKSLRWIAHSREELSVAALCEAVSINPRDTFLNREGIPAVEEILRCCSSLVRRSASGFGLEFAHFTVKEYLQKLDEVADNEFGAYRIQPLLCNIELAEICLTYLNLDDFTQLDVTDQEARARRLKEYALRPYAVWAWSVHAKGNVANERIFRLVQQLFRPSKSINFISWAQDYSLLLYEVHCLSRKVPFFDAVNLRLATTGPLHYAALLAIPELCTWLLHERCEVNQRGLCGTPLQCAIFGRRALIVETDNISANMSYDIVNNDYMGCVDESGDVISTTTILLGGGADPNCYYDNGKAKLSLLGFVARQGWKHTCLKLLRSGAVLDEYARTQLRRWTNGSAIEYGKRTLLEDDYVSVLESMFATDVVKALLAERPSADVDRFHRAAKFGQFDTITELLHDPSLSLDAAETGTGRTALHYAAENGHSDIVTILLEHGADSNLVDSDGRTPISLATKARGPHAFLSLLRQGGDIGAKDLKGYTMIHHAAKNGNVAALIALKERLEMSDASLPSEQNFLQAISQKSAIGKTPLHLAVAGGSFDVLRLLLDSDCDPKALMYDDSTALHCVVGNRSLKSSHVIIVNLLLGHRVDPCHPRRDGATPLHIMIERLCPRRADLGISLEVLETLAWQKGTLLQTNAEGLTALHLLLRRCFSRSDAYDHSSVDDAARWAKMLTVLLEAGADLEAVDPQNQSALRWLVNTFTATTTEVGQKILSHMISTAIDYFGEDKTLIKIITDPALLVVAIKFDQSELVQKLLRWSPEVDLKAVTRPGITPIQAACRYGCDRENMLRLLDLSKARSDPTGMGSNLIRLACQRNDTEACSSVLLLLNVGLDANGRSFRGESALMLAARAGNIDIVNLLIGRGIDPSVSDARGCNVAHYAFDSGHVEVIYALRHCKLDWGAKAEMSIHGQMLRGVTALHLAAKHENVDFLEYLIEEKLISDIDCVTQSGETALNIAVWSAWPRNVAVLLLQGADIMGSGHFESPLHMAARFGDWETVSEFFRHGCDVTIPNKHGLDCRLIALKYGFKDLAQTFEEFARKQVTDNVSTPSQGPKWPSKSSRASEALKVAIKVGDKQLCKRLVDNGADLESGLKFCHGCTPLLYSLIVDRPEIAKFLVRHGASITRQTCRKRTSRGYTPLHYAARYGSLSLLKRLLNRGALELIDIQSPVHPIHLAAACGYTKCVEMILDRSYHGMPLSNREFGRPYLSPEMYRDTRSHGTSSEDLLINLRVDRSRIQWTWEMKPNVAWPSAYLSATPLQIAASNGYIPLVASLLERGALVDFIDDGGRTPLHFAAVAGHVPIIKMLLRFGANLHLPDQNLVTACMCAAERNHLDAVRELLMAGADRWAQDINHRHVLHYAALRHSWIVFFYLLPTATGYELAVEDIYGDTVVTHGLLLADLPQLSSLLNHGLPDQAYFSKKTNVLTTAVRNAHLTTSVLKRFLKRLPKCLLPQILGHQALMGGTPLYAASSFVSPHQADLICMLLDTGAALELEGGDHGTPLMGACAAGRLPAVKVLVSKGAKLHYTKDGSTIRALDKARHFPEIQRWLLVGRHIEGPRLLMRDGTQSATPRTFPKSAGYVIATRIRKSVNEGFSLVRLTTI